MKRLFKGLLAGAVALAPIAAFAGIDGTHHDMSTFVVGEREKCAFCHSVALAGDGSVALGQVGTFCAVVCHDGGQVADAVIDGPGIITPADLSTSGATQGVAVLELSHGMDLIGMPTRDQVADIGNTRWPHTNTAETGATGTIQCTSCHAVHDGTNPPFLNGPLATGDNATAFCQRCHDGGAAILAGTAGRTQTPATMGAHPTEFTATDLGTTGPAANSFKLGRALSYKAPLVRVVADATDVATFNGLKAADAADKWKLGGHFMSLANNMPTATTEGATFGCYTCHSAHRPDGGVELLLGSKNDVRGTNGSSSVICVACHGAGAVAPNTTIIDNPGDTAYTHPANENAKLQTAYSHDHTVHGVVAANANIPSTGGFPIDVTIPAGWPVGTNDSEVLCTTCHNVHGGVVNLMAIRQTSPASISTTASMCLACHSGTAANPASGGNYHHPTSATNYVAPWNLALGWETGDNLGDLSDGMNCPDCHVFQGTSVAGRRTTAHNW